MVDMDNICYADTRTGVLRKEKLKKKSILIILFSYMAINIFANDTFFSLSGGNLVPVNEESVSIEMREETITLDFQENFYEVTVDFTFYNSGDTATLSVGFPFFAPGNLGKGKIYDFKCWTNGEETSFEDIPIIWNSQTDKQLELQNAYTRKIRFNKKEVTTTKVKYKSSYSIDSNIEKNGMSHSHWDGYYLYGTGSSWKNSIGKIKLIIINNLHYGYLDIIRMGDSIWGESIKDKLSKINENTYEAVFTNIEPNFTEIFYIYFENILSDSGPKCFPGYFPFIKQITNQEELKWYKKDQLRIIRNAIYALHGYQFKSEDLKNLFIVVGEEWYPSYNERIKTGFSEESLSEIEKENIRIILEEENKR